MHRTTTHSRLIAALGLAACLLLQTARAAGADTSDLAPPSHDKPWRIPERLAISEERTGLAVHPARSAAWPEETARSRAAGQRFELADLIDLAQRSNPLTREVWQQARRAALAVGLAETAYAPQISIEAIAGFQRTPLPIPTSVMPKGYFVSNSLEAIPMLTLKWLLFDFGKRAGENASARANAYVANVTFNRVHQKLIFDVSRAYFGLGAARGRVSAAARAVRSAEILQDAAESRRERGLATIVVVAQAQRQTAQARLALTKAAGEERTAYANLIAAIGVDPNTRIDVADSSQRPLPDEPPADLGSLVRSALAHRPDVLAALGKVESAEGVVQIQRAAYYPTIAVVGQLFQNAGAVNSDGGPYSSVNRPGGNVLLTLSLPLWDGGARSSRVQIAEAELAAARERVAEAENAAAQQVVAAYNDLRTGLAAYAAAANLREAAQTSYDAALEAFRHGVGAYTDVANEGAALARAHSDTEDAHANVFTAAAALAFAMGTLPDR